MLSLTNIIWLTYIAKKNSLSFISRPKTVSLSNLRSKVFSEFIGHHPHAHAFRWKLSKLRRKSAALKLFFFFSGERPYRCRACKKAFSDSSTLTKHLRIHRFEAFFYCIRKILPTASECWKTSPLHIFHCIISRLFHHPQRRKTVSVQALSPALFTVGKSKPSHAGSRRQRKLTHLTQNHDSASIQSQLLWIQQEILDDTVAARFIVVDHDVGRPPSDQQLLLQEYDFIQ